MTIKSGTDKCPYCDGKGYYYQESSYGMELIQCSCQNKQTNEEWMKSLNTEELVDHLYEVHKGGASVERQAWIEKHKERIKMQIRGWLKAKHIEKE